MVIESVMYFALGALAASLVALLILPAIWGRAVRLTKKRIEAATPMSMAEFRADKDQLRAEFALSTRRLERNVEILRARLAQQLGDFSDKQSDFASIQAERDQHQAIVREFEEREDELRQRILDLEREHTDATQRLRMRDREFSRKASDLEAARSAMRTAYPQADEVDGTALSGEYDEDINGLLAALAVERKRVAFLEDQGRNLIGYLESSTSKSVDGTVAAAELRKVLAIKEEAAIAATGDLLNAEASIASAESRLNEILQDTEQAIEAEESPGALLAEKLSLEAQVAALQDKVLGVEAVIMADWDTDRISLGQMRERLNDVATEVSRLVYAVDAKPAETESLFDRVQKFADDGRGTEEFPAHNGQQGKQLANGKANTPILNRLVALNEAQPRT
ncbi:MAG: hypothetical protein JWN11_713 [Hyphomicrobiales bacterium]|nr:hypothetical protein [Hyphomicrobiales bacterium]